MGKYDHFISQIPSSNSKTESHMGSEFALYKPCKFLTGLTVHLIDYHITIPSTTPPDLYVNGILHRLDHGKILTFNPGDTMFCNQERTTSQYISLLIKPELINRVAEEMGISGKVNFLKLQNQYSKDLIQTIKSLDRETEISHQLT